MKKLLFVLSLLSAGVASAQTAPAALPKQVQVVVNQLESGTNHCDSRIAQGLTDALTNALLQSGRFAIYERGALGAGMQENLIGGGDTGGQIQGADVLVVGTVTAYGEASSGGSACFMGICAGAKEERVVANLRIFDIKTSRIIGTAQVEGKSSSNAASLNLGGFQLGGNQASGLDKAANAMLADAVSKLSASVPANYYR
ncbi:MAG: CsgG/HfaB family protein [Deinococcus sp.]|nr:CsgG/HfaB family protein [Deinococcus sp.]